MKRSKKHSISERSIEKKFRNVQNTQEGIQGVTVWAIHHKDQAEKIVSLWAKIFKESEAPHTLTLMYVCNDITQNCKRKNASVYKGLFKAELPEVVAHLSTDQSVVPPVERIFRIWKERLVFNEETISEFQDALISEDVKETVQQEEIDKKLLAEFKPNKVVESLRGFRRLELDADMKYRLISNLRIDLTNSEAIRQLKDRAHGNEYTTKFEDHSKHLEEFNSDLGKVMQERTALIELLELTEHFYELQYGEALVVANAYKNFGLRVSKQQTQLDDIMGSFPGDDVATATAVSPPHSDATTTSQVIDMEMSDDERGEDDEPPVEPYSPSMMDSPERPVGSPISPNTSLTDLDIVKGVAQPYDPMESQVTFNPRSLLDNVYNPKDTRNNDLKYQGFSTDGDGTPTQDEFMDTSKHSTEEYDPTVKKDATNEDDWDLAYEFLEENMESTNSGAVSISNLTTIQPTTDFTALTNNTATDQPVKSILKGIGLLNSLNQNGSHSSSSSPALTSPNLVTLSDEDQNAKAQREFLERLTKRGPFKPSRFLQKLKEEKDKKPGDGIQFGQFQSVDIPQGVPPVPGPPITSVQIPPPVPVPAPVTHVPAPVTHVPAPVTHVPAPVTHVPAPVTITHVRGIRPSFHHMPRPETVPSLVPHTPPPAPSPGLDARIPPLPPSFPASPVKPDLSFQQASGDFEFPAQDQDMRQFRGRPPGPPGSHAPRVPPPPPPGPPPPGFAGGFPKHSLLGGAPAGAGGPPGLPRPPGLRFNPPPPPDMNEFRNIVSRMDNPSWRPVPPPGPPPPFFRPRFS